jgi:hypothetical protein
VTELIRTLSDKDGLARLLAADALGKIGAPAAIEPLRRLLTIHERECRDLGSPRMLIDLPVYRAALPLYPSLGHYDPVVVALARLGDTWSINTLIKWAAFSEPTQAEELYAVLRAIPNWNSSPGALAAKRDLVVTRHSTEVERALLQIDPEWRHSPEAEEAVTRLAGLLAHLRTVAAIVQKQASEQLVWKADGTVITKARPLEVPELFVRSTPESVCGQLTESQVKHFVFVYRVRSPFLVIPCGIGDT